MQQSVHQYLEQKYKAYINPIIQQSIYQSQLTGHPEMRSLKQQEYSLNYMVNCLG